jgi:ferredoxin
MLVIDPEVCIDCGVCEPECPVGAIFQDTALGSEDAIRWEEINREYAAKWPNITKVRLEDVPKDAKDWNQVPNKFEEHFSPRPGKGNV